MLEPDLDTTEKIVSVIAGTIAIVGGLAIWRRRQPNTEHSSAPQQQIATGGNTQAVSVNIGASAVNPPVPTPVLPTSSVTDLKRVTNILFVDDDRGFKIVGVLKKMGWEHTKLVPDITSLEQPALLDSHVVFVDIQGVGKAMQYGDEGLGLALAIKRRHPLKKVVIYSAEQNGARFHEALQEADYSLPKTAEPIRFEDTIVRVLAK